MGLQVFLVAVAQMKLRLSIRSPHLHGVEKLAEAIEELTAGGCTASFGELLRMLLKLGDFSLVDVPESVTVEVLLLQPPSHLLVSRAADTEHGQVACDLVVVSDILFRIKGILVLVHRSLLIQPVRTVSRQAKVYILLWATHSLIPIAKSR